jgi:hypothetical protein
MGWGPEIGQDRVNTGSLEDIEQNWLKFRNRAGLDLVQK